MKIAVLPGDGIGVEIVAEAVKVLNNLDLKFERTLLPEPPIPAGRDSAEYLASYDGAAVAAATGAVVAAGLATAVGATAVAGAAHALSRVATIRAPAAATNGLRANMSNPP